MRTILSFLVLSLALGAAEKKPIQWLEARVVAQEQAQNGEEARAGGGFSVNGGGPARIKVIPIIDNYVTIETTDARLKMVEARPGRFSRGPGPLIAPVNGTVKYTRAANQFTLLDAEGKEHKFTLVSDVRLSANPPASR